MKKTILLIFLFLNSTQIFSQENYNKCNTTKLVNEEVKKNTDYTESRAKSLDLSKAKKQKTTITIPVVVHVIHRQNHVNIGSGTNISNAQIEDQLRILNEDFSKTNPEFPNPPRNTFLNNAGNPDIEFCLATIDPNGDPTSGITRTPTTKLSFDADTESNDMKRYSTEGRDGWDPYRYLNIWVCNLSNAGSGMTLGYAYLPGLLANPFNTSNHYKDGLVVDYNFFGTIGVASPSSDGRTPTHEIGHYLGLMHTFCENQGGGCCDNDNNNWGGSVDDTPAAEAVYFGPVTANTNNNTCNDLAYSNIFNTDVLDMDENYMSYAANTWMFSEGQVDVMLSVLNTSEFNGGRSTLKNSNVSTNCTGIISSTETLITNINLNIFPNPTKGTLSIRSSAKIISISAYNMIGKEIMSNIRLNNNIFDVSQLSNGIYFLNINTEKGIVTKKIVLSK